MFLKIAKAMSNKLRWPSSSQKAIFLLQKHPISFIPLFKLVIRMAPIILPFVMSTLSSFGKTERGRVYINKMPPFVRTFIQSMIESSNKNFGQQTDDFNFNRQGSNADQNEKFYRGHKNEYSHSPKQEKKLKDYYAVLGLPRTATAVEIKDSYKQKVKMYHPDRIPDASIKEKKEATVKFRKVVEAYSVLGDVENKRRYDNNVEF